jgi:transposase-like protein
MAHSRYLRQMARSLRVEQRLTVDELAARMSLPRSTIYYWVRDLPLRGEGAESGQAHGPGVASPRAHARASREAEVQAPREAQAQAPREVSRARSEAAYREGLDTFEELSLQPTFRDFVCIYLVQGEQRDRTRVALSGFDPAVMRLASRWIRRLTDRAPLLALQYGAGQSLQELRRFWSETIGAEPSAIRARGSSDAESGERPPARLPHGLLTVTVDDALLRARLQGWMHRARESWR